MNIQLSGVNMEITEPLKSYAMAKLQKLYKHSVKITRIVMSFHIESKQIHSAECHVSMYDKGVLSAKAAADDMYKTVDGVVKKLIRQITKYKEKHS